MGSPGWKAAIFKWRKSCHDRLIRPKWTGRASQRLWPSRYQVSVLVLSSAQQAGRSFAPQLSPLQLASTASLGINTHTAPPLPLTTHTLEHQPIFQFTIHFVPQTHAPVNFPDTNHSAAVEVDAVCTLWSNLHLCISHRRFVSPLDATTVTAPPFFGHHHHHCYCNTLVVLVHFCIRFH